MKKLLFAITALMLSVAAQAQTTDSEVLDVTRKANDYFMAQNPTPESDTFVHGKKRPSSLWTRGVYYEGLTALWEIDRQQRYIDYIDRWANYHQWTPRNGAKTTHADDQCCSQTYSWRYRQTGDKRMLVSAVENLDMEIAGGKVDWWCGLMPSRWPCPSSHRPLSPRVTAVISTSACMSTRRPAGAMCGSSVLTGNLSVLN